MRIVLVSIFTVLVFFNVDTADACSPAPADNVSAPSNEKAYDASLSPASPSLSDAILSSSTSRGCGSDDCGDQDWLRIDAQVPMGTEMLRVDIEGEPTIYLRPYIGGSSRTWNVRAFGYGEHDALTLEVRAIGPDGYASLPVMILATSDRDSGGCNTTGNSTTGGMVLLACLFLYLQHRRRGHISTKATKD